MDLMCGILDQRVVHQSIVRGVLARQAEPLRRLYRTLRDVMEQTLREQFGDQLTWNQPKGGFFLWARLPERYECEALLAKAEPLDAKLWRHEVEAEPLTTPEAWASLKQRLIAHASTIGHADLGRMYREDWLKRFYELRRPAGQQGGNWSAPQRKSGRKSWNPPPAPVGNDARAIASSGIDAPTARALMLGFANYPEELAAHCEQLASLPIPDKGTAKMRDELVNAAFSGATLDRDALSTILGSDEAAGGNARRPLGFSFTRRDSDPTRARSDLAAAVEIIAAAEEVEQALGQATERLKRDMTDEALEEQQRLVEAQQGLRQRLAQLAGTD
jgi:DNA primase